MKLHVLLVEPPDRFKAAKEAQQEVEGQAVKHLLLDERMQSQGHRAFVGLRHRLRLLLRGEAGVADGRENADRE